MSEGNDHHDEAVIGEVFASPILRLAIDRDDLDEVPFHQTGGLGRAYELFGEQLAAILEELNARLAA